MAKIKDTTVVSTADASKVSKKQPINAHHITTQSFLRPSPISAIELFPNRKITQSVNSFCRLDPLPRPVLSRAKVFNRAFFVPYRTVFCDFTQFVTSTPIAYDPTDSTTYIFNDVPTISNDTFLLLLQQMSTAVQGTTFDFKITNSTVSTIVDSPYILNPDGVFFYKVIRSLGYNPIFNQGIASQVRYSALPLLSYIKIILDWYYPSAYAYSQDFALWESVFTSHILTDINSALNMTNIYNFFKKLAYCSYEPDYFVSSWDNPVGPNSAAFENSYGITDITNDSAYKSVVSNGLGVNGTPLVYGSANGNPNAAPQRFSQYIDDALKSLTDYTKRHQLAGVRALDRYLAEFGINLQSELMKRSYYLGFNSFELNFYDVMSHADTSDASLGDFAGKSFANGSKQFGYSADEYGMFIIINSVIPQLSTYQGTNRHVFHRSPLDFYRGDFDKLGCQAIYKQELYVPKNGGVALMASGYVNGVYSFISRYGEYQNVPDLVTGRFDCDGQNLDLQGYFQGRDCDQFDTVVPANFVHNIDFVLAGDYNYYNNIFYNSKAVEPIVFSHDFTVQFEDSSLPLWDDYEFENKYRQVKENINGTTVN